MGLVYTEVRFWNLAVGESPLFYCKKRFIGSWIQLIVVLAMAERNKEAVVERIRQIAERVGGDTGVEIVDVELLGAGRNRVLRITIDRPSSVGADPNAPQGVSHADCEYISLHVGTILDVEDVVPGEHYSLEVCSPGVERKLSKPREFERFVGQKVKVLLRQPLENQRHWVGALKAFDQGVITLEPSPGKRVQFPIEQVEKANLKFDW